MEKIKSGADFGKDDQYDGFELFTQMARANSKLVLPAKMGKKRKNTDATVRYCSVYQGSRMGEHPQSMEHKLLVIAQYPK